MPNPFRLAWDAACLASFMVQFGWWWLRTHCARGRTSPCTSGNQSDLKGEGNLPPGSSNMDDDD